MISWELNEISYYILCFIENYSYTCFIMNASMFVLISAIDKVMQVIENVFN